jgi:Ca2+-binding EF-hand superfamily protein
MQSWIFKVLGVSLLFSSLAAAQGPNGFGQPNPEEMKKMLLQQFDRNGDGQIDEQEKKAAAEMMHQRMMQAIQSGNVPEELKKRLDRNGDGKLDPQELAAAKDMLGQMPHGSGGQGFGGQSTGGSATGEMPIPPEMIKKFDKNKDGKLDDTEKKAAYAAMNAQGKSRTQLLKEKLDTNGDGKIDEAEKKAAAEAYKNKGKKTEEKK